MSYQPRWNCCGRRRTAKTTTNRGGCLLCQSDRLAKGRATLAKRWAERRAAATWAQCGHPRTPANTATPNTCPRCRMCKNAGTAEWRSEKRAEKNRKAPRVRQVPAPLSPRSLSFELVSVQSITEANQGRSYSFPLKQRSA